MALPFPFPLSSSFPGLVLSLTRLGWGVTSPSRPKGVVTPADSGVDSVDEVEGDGIGSELHSTSADAEVVDMAIDRRLEIQVSRWNVDGVRRAGMW